MNVKSFHLYLVEVGMMAGMIACDPVRASKRV